MAEKSKAETSMAELSQDKTSVAEMSYVRISYLVQNASECKEKEKANTFSSKVIEVFFQLNCIQE